MSAVADHIVVTAPGNFHEQMLSTPHGERIMQLAAHLAREFGEVTFSIEREGLFIGRAAGVGIDLVITDEAIAKSSHNMLAWVVGRAVEDRWRRSGFDVTVSTWLARETALLRERFAEIRRDLGLPPEREFLG